MTQHCVECEEGPWRRPSDSRHPVSSTLDDPALCWVWGRNLETSFWQPPSCHVEVLYENGRSSVTVVITTLPTPPSEHTTPIIIIAVIRHKISIQSRQSDFGGLGERCEAPNRRGGGIWAHHPQCGGAPGNFWNFTCKSPHFGVYGVVCLSVFGGDTLASVFDPRVWRVWQYRDIHAVLR